MNLQTWLEFLANTVNATSLIAAGIVTTTCGLILVSVAFLYKKLYKTKTIPTFRISYKDRRKVTPMPEGFWDAEDIKDFIKEFTVFDEKGRMLEGTVIKIQYGHIDPDTMQPVIIGEATRARDSLKNLLATVDMLDTVISKEGNRNES